MTFVDYDQNITVSIPNGMEFYRILINIKSYARKFQFPTGWNSTSRVNQKIYLKNCFNSQRDGILPKVSIWISSATSFNSQRDGILRNNDTDSRVKIRFQFPTGWNSTLWRDDRRPTSSNLFQFPTGWNSTIVLARGFSTLWVSIPNGMEFYAMLQINT